MLTFFFFNDTATTEIYTLSLHDALPISQGPEAEARRVRRLAAPGLVRLGRAPLRPALQRERHAALGQGPRPPVAGGAPRPSRGRPAAAGPLQGSSPELLREALARTPAADRGAPWLADPGRAGP